MADLATLTRLRRMTGVPEAEWPDEDLTEYLLIARIEDTEGNEPDSEGYVDTYDLHRAAAMIFRDRAATVADVAYDTQVDMTKASRSQIVANFIKMARFHEQHSIPRYSGARDLFPDTEAVATDNISADA